MLRLFKSFVGPSHTGSLFSASLQFARTERSRDSNKKLADWLAKKVCYIFLGDEEEKVDEQAFEARS